MSLDAVKINQESNQAVYERSTFGQVIFQNIPETFPADAHVECSFSVTPLLEPTSRDWIGLYKIGWSSSKDYLIYHWVPIPSNFKPGTELKGSVLFQSHHLPNEDGEFYQFCYVTSNGQIRGASTPFQFKEPGAFEFVELEDEENDILIVTSKTLALQTELERVKDMNEDLEKNFKTLELEKGDLLNQMAELNQQMNEAKTTILTKDDEAKELQEKLDLKTGESNEMVLLQESLREKVKTVTDEKEEILKRLEMNETYIKALQDKIKTLTGEKDALMGRVRMLEEEKLLYQTHVSDSEGAIQNHVREIEHLQQSCQENDASRAALSQRLSQLESQVEKQQEKLWHQNSQIEKNLKNENELIEKLRNSEDRLTTMEQCKVMLNQEVVTVHAAHDRMAESLERSRSEAHNLKAQVARLETDYQTRTVTLKQEINLLQKENSRLSVSISKLEDTLETTTERATYLEQQKADAEDADGAMYALKMAQVTLEKRLAKYKKQYNDLRSQMEEMVKTQKTQLEVEHDLRQEIKDLKERLLMGAEEYTHKFVDCRKLQIKLKKMKAKLRQHGFETSPETSRRSSITLEQASPVKTCPVSVVVTQENGSQADIEEFRSRKDSSTQSSPDSENDLSMNDMLQQIDDLSKELETRNLRKSKYKNQIHSLKERNQLLQKQLLDDIQQYRNELEKSKKEFQDLKTEHKEKTKSLSATIEKQRKQIRSLKHELHSVKSKEMEGPAWEPLRYPFPNHDSSETGEMSAVPVSHHCVIPMSPSPSSPVRPAVPPRSGKAFSSGQIVISGHPPMEVITSEPQAVPDLCLTTAEAPEPTNLPYPNFPEKVDLSDMESSGSGYELLEGCDKDDQELVPLSQPALVPLPAPIQPEVLPSARYAAVKAAVNIDGKPSSDVCWGSNMHHHIIDLEDDTDSVEEKFMDAAGDPQRVCPICYAIFPTDCHQFIFEDHVETHFGPICPMCDQQFPKETSQESYEEHVQGHLKD